jgi:Flp pilus assembly pilin Flp
MDRPILQHSGAKMPANVFFSEVWSDDQGQDIAEYALILAVVLVIMVGTITVLFLQITDRYL